jgi:CRP-like cAMP-binding protein
MKRKKKRTFDAQVFLESVGVSRKVADFRRNQTIFSQGDAANDVFYVQKGSVKLTIVNESGKEAIVAIFGPGDFFGEGGMAGQTLRMGTTTAIGPTTLLTIGKQEMIRVLHAEHALSDRFIAHMLARNIRVEADLVDQLFNSIEKRLARTLLLLRPLWQGRRDRASASEGVPRDPCGNDRYDPDSGEYVHEQVQEARLHRIQRRNQSQKVPSQRCPARVKSVETIHKTACGPGGWAQVH